MTKRMHSQDPKVKASLDVLEGRLEQIIEQNPDDAAFWKAFSTDSEPILASTNERDAAYARGRLDCMLRNAGMIPGEEEGTPCE